MYKSTKRGQIFLTSLLVLCCIIIVALMSSGCFQEEKRDVTTRTIRMGDVTTVKDKPFRWNTGTTWSHRWIWDELKQLEQCTGENDYLKAEKAGIAHKLPFGTRIKILKVKPGFRYQFNKYQVEVLSGELVGKIGWTKFDSIKDYYITE